MRVCTVCRTEKSEKHFARVPGGYRRRVCSDCITERKRLSRKLVPLTEEPDVRTASGSHCPKCFDLPWRVVGGQCKCGLRYSEEVPRSVDDVLAGRQFRCSPAMFTWIGELFT